MTTTTWNIDVAHSSVQFSVRHLMVAKVRGSFKTWSGALQLDDADITKSKVSVKIETASVDTNDEKRDGHLKSADFFNVEKNPHMTFESKKITADGSNLKVTGDLTLNGVTKEVVLDVEDLGRMKDPWGKERAGFSAKTSINRMDYGVKWSQVLEAGGLMVGEKVEITLDLQAVKA